MLNINKVASKHLSKRIKKYFGITVCKIRVSIFEYLQKFDSDGGANWDKLF